MNRNRQNRIRFVYTHFNSCDRCIGKTFFYFSKVFRVMQSHVMSAKSSMILKLTKIMIIWLEMCARQHIAPRSL